MDFTNFTTIISKFTDFSVKRSALLKDINDMENDILSISERIEEIRSNHENLDRKQQTDAFSRARDKRKRVRSDIAEIKHDVRMIEVEITKLEMQLKWLVDYAA
jgi:predicted  nucleic acid-binding Zn-ribbon protein